MSYQHRKTVNAAGGVYDAFFTSRLLVFKRFFFTCGSRPAGLLVTLVVVVVVVIVVVGGGTTFIHGLSRESMYGFEKFKIITPYFCHFSWLVQVKGH